MKLRELGLSLSSWATKDKRIRDRQTARLNAKLAELSTYEISEEVLEEVIEIKLDLNF